MKNVDTKGILVQWIRKGWVGKKMYHNGAEWIQRSRGERIGVMVATGPGKIGWSLVSSKERKSCVNWEKGFNKALLRARGGANLDNVPRRIAEDVQYFFERSHKIKRWEDLV